MKGRSGATVVNVSERTTYNGFSKPRTKTLPKYSPITPSANNCTPEKMEIIDAKKGNPGKFVPSLKYLTNTYTNSNVPNPVNMKPNKLARRSGSELNAVVILTV